MSDEFRTSFKTFLDHVGKKPSPELVLDRLDNNKGYERGNLGWVSRHQSALNSRPDYDVRYYTFNGKTQPLKEWGLELNVPHQTLNTRIREGFAVENVFTSEKFIARKGQHHR